MCLQQTPYRGNSPRYTVNPFYKGLGRPYTLISAKRVVGKETFFLRCSQREPADSPAFRKSHSSSPGKGSIPPGYAHRRQKEGSSGRGSGAAEGEEVRWNVHNEEGERM